MTLLGKTQQLKRRAGWPRLLRKSVGIPYWERLTLRSRLYVGLVASGVVLGAVSVVAYSLGATWASAWLPNFIAEWTGIFLVVVLVGRLLARHEEQERARKIQPMRDIAARDLAVIAQPILDYVVQHSSEKTLPRLRERIAEFNYIPPLTEYLDDWKYEWPNDPEAAVREGVAVADEALARFEGWESRYLGLLSVDERWWTSWIRHHTERVREDFGSDYWLRESKSDRTVHGWHTLAYLLGLINDCCGLLLHRKGNHLDGLWEGAVHPIRFEARRAVASRPAIGAELLYEEGTVPRQGLRRAKVSRYEQIGDTEHMVIELEDGSERSPAPSDRVMVVWDDPSSPPPETKDSRLHFQSVVEIEHTFEVGKA